jgi:antitoxin (DNA-binding transcriptional repressor) of toxin-antitoxin stability system
MKVSILDLRRKLSSIVKVLDRNESVTLTYRGHTKATIVPAKGKTALDIQNHSAFGIWSDRDDEDMEDQIDRKTAKKARRKKTSIPWEKAKKQLRL